MTTMREFWLMPPVAFIIVLVVVGVSTLIAGRMALKPKKGSEGAKKAYACGEDNFNHLVQPDYSQFFPFAFFFTILHVVALMITTVPAGTGSTLYVAIFYVCVAVTGLWVLLRR